MIDAASEPLTQILRAAARALGAGALEMVGEPLRGGDRTVVIRAVVAGGPGRGTSNAHRPGR